MTNIAIVVLDTVRSDAFEKHFDWLPGTTFTNAWSISHRTPPVHAGLFTGKYGSEVGVVPDANALNCDREVLAELLSRQGYRTRAFSANPYISKYFNYDRGFEEFHTTWELERLSEHVFDWVGFANENSHRGVSRYLRAITECVKSDARTVPSLGRGAMVKLRDLGFNIGPRDDGATEALEFIRDSSFGNQEFLFVNLMEAHEPYFDPEAAFYQKPSEPNSVELTMYEHKWSPEKLYERYDRSCAYLANCYRKIFDELRADFDIIVTCSDHGELFGEDKIWGHFHGVYPELVNIPLHVYRGRSECHEAAYQVSLLDVYPTVLKSLGRPIPELEGRVLFDAKRGDQRYFTECHGMAPDRLKQLRPNQSPATNPNRFETPLFGAILSSECYVYDTIHETRTEGNCQNENVQEALSQAKTRFCGNQRQPKDDISSAVQNRLEELGYV